MLIILEYSIQHFWHLKGWPEDSAMASNQAADSARYVRHVRYVRLLVPCCRCACNILPRWTKANGLVGPLDGVPRTEHVAPCWCFILCVRKLVLQFAAVFFSVCVCVFFICFLLFHVHRVLT